MRIGLRQKEILSKVNNKPKELVPTQNVDFQPVSTFLNLTG